MIPNEIVVIISRFCDDKEWIFLNISCKLFRTLLQPDKNKRVTKYLIEKSYYDSEKALELAINYNNLDIVKMIYELRDYCFWCLYQNYLKLLFNNKEQTEISLWLKEQFILTFCPIITMRE